MSQSHVTCRMSHVKCLCPFVIMMMSAVPLRTKRNALTEEVKRRLRNCHEDVPEEEIGDILSRFSQKMKNSGYNHKFREQVINAG